VSARLSVERLRPAGAGERAARPAARADFGGARLASGASRLRPRDAGGILDLAVEGLLARFGPCFGVALAVWLPFLQVQELFGLSGLDELSLQLTSLSYQMLQFVPTGITTSVVASLMADVLANPAAPVMPGLWRGLRRAPGVIVVLCVAALFTLLTAVVLFFLCGLGVFVGQWLTFVAAPAYTLEARAPAGARGARARSGPLRRVLGALGRSLDLARGGASLGRWALVAFVGFFLFALALESGGTALNVPEARAFVSQTLGLGGPLAGFLLGTVAAAFAALGACARAAIMTAFYLDLCVRREGLDLAVELARRAPHAPEAA